jgi:hypothetical protein
VSVRERDYCARCGYAVEVGLIVADGQVNEIVYGYNTGRLHECFSVDETAGLALNPKEADE